MKQPLIRQLRCCAKADRFVRCEVGSFRRGASRRQPWVDIYLRCKRHMAAPPFNPDPELLYDRGNGKKVRDPELLRYVTKPLPEFTIEKEFPA